MKDRSNYTQTIWKLRYALRESQKSTTKIWLNVEISNRMNTYSEWSTRLNLATCQSSNRKIYLPKGSAFLRVWNWTLLHWHYGFTPYSVLKSSNSYQEIPEDNFYKWWQFCLNLLSHLFQQVSNKNTTKPFGKRGLLDFRNDFHLTKSLLSNRCNIDTEITTSRRGTPQHRDSCKQRGDGGCCLYRTKPHKDLQFSRKAA